MMTSSVTQRVQTSQYPEPVRLVLLFVNCIHYVVPLTPDPYTTCTMLYILPLNPTLYKLYAVLHIISNWAMFLTVVPESICLLTSVYSTPSLLRHLRGHRRSDWARGRGQGLFTKKLHPHGMHGVPLGSPVYLAKRRLGTFGLANSLRWFLIKQTPGWCGHRSSKWHQENEPHPEWRVCRFQVIDSSRHYTN